MPNCKFCDAVIEWSNINGKNVPMNLDNTQHRCIANKPKLTQQQALSISEDQVLQILAKLIKRELN